MLKGQRNGFFLKNSLFLMDHRFQTVDLHPFGGEAALVFRHDVGRSPLRRVEIPGEERDLKGRGGHRLHGVFKEIRVVRLEAEVSAVREQRLVQLQKFRSGEAAALVALLRPRIAEVGVDALKRARGENLSQVLGIAALRCAAGRKKRSC